MFDTHWTVAGIPFVILGGIAVFYFLRRHKERPSNDHVLKL